MKAKLLVLVAAVSVGVGASARATETSRFEISMEAHDSRAEGVTLNDCAKSAVANAFASGFYFGDARVSVSRVSHQSTEAVQAHSSHYMFYELEHAARRRGDPLATSSIRSEFSTDQFSFLLRARADGTSVRYFGWVSLSVVKKTILDLMGRETTQYLCQLSQPEAILCGVRSLPVLYLRETEGPDFNLIFRGRTIIEGNACHLVDTELSREESRLRRLRLLFNDNCDSRDSCG